MSRIDLRVRRPRNWFEQRADWRIARATSVAWSLLLVCHSSCGYSLPPVEEHTIAFAKDGMPVEYRVNKDDLIGPNQERIPPGEAYQRHVAQIIEGLTKFQRADPADRRRPMMLYLHGGLNTYASAYARASAWQTQEHASGSTPLVYPIFVCWHSGLISSYLDHLFFVRQGEHKENWGVWVFPLVLVSDLTRSLLRAPFVWGSQIDIEVGDWLGDKTEFVAWGEDCRTSGEQFTGASAYVLTLPLKIVGTLFIDALGTSAWEMMLRRTRLLFAPEDSANGREWIEPRAPFVHFLGELARHQRNSTPPRATEDILVAHSMGAIVANRMLRLAVARPEEFPVFGKVVYVAPACSVADCISSLAPYLEKYRSAELYILGLHPRAEASESYAYDLAPRGTLLEWLDQFLDKPLTPRDRVVGKLENLVPELGEYGDGLLTRIHVRSGNVGCSCQPPPVVTALGTEDEDECDCMRRQTHGGLGDYVLDRAQAGLDFKAIGNPITTDAVRDAYAVGLYEELESLRALYPTVDSLEDELTRPEQVKIREKLIEVLRRMAPSLPPSIRETIEHPPGDRPSLDAWIEEVARSRSVNGSRSTPNDREALRRQLDLLVWRTKAHIEGIDPETRTRTEGKNESR